MNLLSSNRLITTMRRKFEIQKDIDQLSRNKNSIEQIYQGKQGNIEKRNGILIAAASLVITLSPIVDSIKPYIVEYTASWSPTLKFIFNELLIGVVILLVFIGVIVFFAFKSFAKKFAEKFISKK
jgi:ABC-type multidrug transport system fused ATPase/permease subunit